MAVQKPELAAVLVTPVAIMVLIYVCLLAQDDAQKPNDLIEAHFLLEEKYRLMEGNESNPLTRDSKFSTNQIQHVEENIDRVIKLLSSGVQNKSYSVAVKAGTFVSDLPHFWRSTGFCPPDPHQKACEWFSSPDMMYNLAYIGSIPHQGVHNVRVHYLLDAVFVLGIKNGQPVYNFTCLDKFIKLLHQNGLKPGFEIMGNPSDFFTDLENKTQIYLWKDLVYQLANRYIDLFGLANVAEWNFESWNEPKLVKFDGLNFTHQGFLNYYDACSEGLKQASPRLRLGAPSGGCKDNYNPSSYCWVLLNHLNDGINYFTGKKDTRVDFISIHEKGIGPSNSAVILKKEKNFHKLLRIHQPNLINKPLVNDEGDPLVTWSKPLDWRADATYSSMIAKVAYLHHKRYIADSSSEITFELLSNDNGFLSYQPHVFSQRTLLARFQVNTTQPPHVHFIRKPAHSVMGLLSLLGEKQLGVDTQSIAEFGNAVGILASAHIPDSGSPQDSWQLSLLMYYSIDTHHTVRHNANTDLNVTVQIQDLTSVSTKEILYVVYVLDNHHGNPWEIWTSAGSPRTPKSTLFSSMREHEDPIRLSNPVAVEVKDHTLSIPLWVSLPGVTLLHICAKASNPPDQVTELTLYIITCNQILVVWSDSCVNSKCILRYEVEYSQTGDAGTFHRINSQDSIFTVFVYMPKSALETGDCDQVNGYYRVRAVDYWNRPGEYSLVAHH